MTSARDDRLLTQPPLAEFMTRYLGRQASAHVAGFAAAETGGVQPYEAVPVQAVDPRQAWDEATAVLGHFAGAAVKASKPIADWPQLMAAQEPQTALPMAAAHYPQLVRDLAPLFHAEKLSDLVKEPGPVVDLSGMKVGSPSEFPGALVSVGLSRLARQFEAAGRILRTVKPPAAWRDAWANEEAALLWQTGRREEAARRWRALPDSAPVLFNCGMAALFLDNPAEARAALRTAVERLPESSGWHHLARLYLALAES